MYDSDLSDWTAVKMGPQRDVVGELAKAVRAAGPALWAPPRIASNTIGFMDGGRSIPSDVNDPQYASFYGPAQTWLEDKRRRRRSPNDWTYV